jgi:hypothetical protein
MTVDCDLGRFTAASQSQYHHQTFEQKKMRHSRSKAYRKLMAMYSTSFGFRQPYQVLGACISRQPDFGKNFTPHYIFLHVSPFSGL